MPGTAPGPRPAPSPAPPPRLPAVPFGSARTPVTTTTKPPSGAEKSHDPKPQRDQTTRRPPLPAWPGAGSSSGCAGGGNEECKIPPTPSAPPAPAPSSPAPPQTLQPPKSRPAPPGPLLPPRPVLSPLHRWLPLFPLRAAVGELSCAKPSAPARELPEKPKPA